MISSPARATLTCRSNVTVALLRAEAGRRPHDAQLRALVESCPRSARTSARWAAHDVRIHHNGVKQFRHPVVGDLELGHCTLELPAQESADLRLTIYTAEPGWGSEEGVQLLAGWAATCRSATSAAAPGGT